MGAIVGSTLADLDNGGDVLEDVAAVVDFAHDLGDPRAILYDLGGSQGCIGVSGNLSAFCTFLGRS